MFTLKTKIALATLSVFMAVAAIMVLTSSQSVRAHAQSVGNTVTAVEQNNQVNGNGPDNEIAKPEKGSESAVEKPEGTSLEKDLPGGHQDPNGVNVGHQFDGVE